MRLMMVCFLAFVGLPLEAQQKGVAKTAAKAKTPGKAAAKPTGPVLTGEAYRDLILSTADGMQEMGTYGAVGPGVGSAKVEGIGSPVPCIMMFSLEQSKVQAADKRRAIWEAARVPDALKPSHAEVLEWMKTAVGVARNAPNCMVPLMQSTMPQLAFFGVMGRYEDIRKRAASALEGMGVTLPPLPAPVKQ